MPFRGKIGRVGRPTANLVIVFEAFKVAGNPVFSRSTNLESKLIEFFVLLKNCSE